MTRTALVHYWLVNMRGGEQVLRHLMDLYPQADVFTNVYDPAATGKMFHGRERPVTTSINGFPFAKRIYPLYLPFMPRALEALEMNKYDLIISSESGPAKWVIPAPHARHICYVHSPMRYLWDQRALYRQRVPRIARPLVDHVASSMRTQDVISAARVDDFVANSTFVAKRIERYYRRTAAVIPPPVQQDDFGPPVTHEDFYLFAGQLVGYKAVRSAVDACLSLGRRLVVVGDGPDKSYVERFAANGVDYRGRVDRDELVRLMSTCKALLFPGIEDFGIVPVEVLAAGRPVIALGAGGVLDTINDRVTGILYRQGTTDALKAAILEFEEWLPDFVPRKAVTAAAAYEPSAFTKRWTEFVACGATEGLPGQGRIQVLSA